MESEEASKDVPEDLVEKIVAMMPFPSIYIARGLTKAWRTRFSSISSEDDDARKSFQRQVAERSNKWETFTPVYIAKENSIAYNGTTQTWQKMPSMSFLPDEFLNRANLQMEGALLYASEPMGVEQLYVANVLTRSCKPLPPCPGVRFTQAACKMLNLGCMSPPPCPNAVFQYAFCEKLVISASLGSYKVIRFCRAFADGRCLHCRRTRGIVAHIYDSNAQAWKTKDLRDLPIWFWGLTKTTNCLHLKGILYMVTVKDPRYILAYNIEEGTFEVFKMRYTETRISSFISSVDLLVVGNANLFMVVTEDSHGQTYRVLKIDLNSQELSEVARGPPAALDVGKTYLQPVGQGSYIYFGMEVHSSNRRMLAYNLEASEWSCLVVPGSRVSSITNPALGVGIPQVQVRKHRWIDGSSFQPGLSPFMAV